MVCYTKPTHGIIRTCSTLTRKTIAGILANLQVASSSEKVCCCRAGFGTPAAIAAQVLTISDLALAEQGRTTPGSSWHSTRTCAMHTCSLAALSVPSQVPKSAAVSHSSAHSTPKHMDVLQTSCSAPSCYPRRPRSTQNASEKPQRAHTDFRRQQIRVPLTVCRAILIANVSRHASGKMCSMPSGTTSNAGISSWCTTRVQQCTMS